MSVASSGGQTGRVTLAELGRVTIAWDDTDPWQQDFSILVVPTGHRADDLDGSFARALADRLGPQGWAAFKDAARAAAANSPHYGPDAPILFRAPKAALLGRMHRYYVLITVFSSPRHPVSMKQVIAGLIYLLGDERPLALPMVLMPIPGAGDGGLQLEEPIAQCLAQLHRMRAILRKTPRAEFVFTSRQELNIPRLRGISDGLESLAEIYSPWPECDKVVRWAIRLAERLIYRTTLGADLVVSASDLLTALVYASKSKECSAYFKQPYKNILARFAKGWITATVDDYLSKPVIESGEVVFGSLRPWMAHAMGHAKESGRKLITVVDLILTMDPAIEVKGVDLLTLRSDVARAWEAENQKFDLTDIKVEGEEVTFDPEVTATLEEMVQSSSTPPPEPPPPLNTLRITSFNSDDIDGPDLLGVDRDAKAFADLICLRAAKPPLSIGLFGNWGSGKSFFMGRIKQNIQTITAEARHTENSPFCGTVVPIHFNAWHYVEQNLWASLVHHLFQELDGWIREKSDGVSKPDQLFAKLATARHLTFEALEELVALGLRAYTAEKDTERAHEAVQTQTLQSMEGLASVLGHVFATEIDAAKGEICEKLEQYAKEQGTTLKNMRDKTEKLISLWESGKTFWGKLGVWVKSPRRLLRDWRLWILFLCCTTLTILFSNLSMFLPDGADWVWLRLIQPILVYATPIVSTGWAWVRLIHPYLSKLKAARDALNKIAEAEEQRQQIRLQQSKTALQECEARFKRTREQLVTAEQEFAAQSTAARLTHFIRDRAGGGEYSKHLTLVATIRKDFQSLSDLIREAGRSTPTPGPAQHGSEAGAAELQEAGIIFRRKLQDLLDQHQERLPPTVIEAIKRAMPEQAPDPQAQRDRALFDRIVLYIDDLDRCPPEKVVEVLQAVHLLLAFDLFVVVVAVDVRWVEQSLERTYAGMLTGKGGQGGEMASPRDYLEKIFQIPFWVEPMDGEACSRFLTGLMDRIAEGDQVPWSPASERTPISPALPLPKDSGPAPAPAPKGPRVDETDEDVPGLSEDEDVLETAAPDDEPVRQEPGPQPAPVQPAPVRPVPTPQTVVLSPLSAIDRAEIAAVAPLLGGVPRRMKRFLNVYQLLKTQVNAMALTDELPDQRALAIGLAIWLGFANTEMEQTHEAAIITDMAAALAQGGPRFHALLLERAKIAGLDLDAPGVKDLFARIVELAQRFSFNGPGGGLLPVAVPA